MRARGWHEVMGASRDDLRRAEIEALFAYGDIIDLPAHVSQRHPRQPRDVRAAQFAPFAALTGFEDVIEEARRRTVAKVEINEDERAVMDGVLQEIEARMGNRPTVEVVYFEPDDRKGGGAYVELCGPVEKVDRCGRVLVMADGRVVPLDDVSSLELIG